MIYKILGKDVCDALVNDAKFIIFSFDGEFALVSSDVDVSNYILSYHDGDLGALKNDPLYKQPCKDC